MNHSERTAIAMNESASMNSRDYEWTKKVEQQSRRMNHIGRKALMENESKYVNSNVLEWIRYTEQQ